MGGAFASPELVHIEILVERVRPMIAPIGAGGKHPTSELCKRVYRVTKIEKKHRVAVLRAMQTLVERDAVSIWRVRLESKKSDDEWFNAIPACPIPRHHVPRNGLSLLSRRGKGRIN